MTFPRILVGELVDELDQPSSATLRTVRPFPRALPTLSGVIQVLVDADNVPAARLRALLRTLPSGEYELVVAGSPRALAAVDWPVGATVTAVEGWQEADVVLARAYRAGAAPLVLASGDGDFAHLAAGHAGPVLVVSDRPAARLRRVGTVVDPVTQGLDVLRNWFDAVLD